MYHEVLHPSPTGTRAERRRAQRGEQKAMKSAARHLQYKDTDVVTVGDFKKLAGVAFRQYHERFHTPWYARLWARVRKAVTR